MYLYLYLNSIKFCSNLGTSVQLCAHAWQTFLALKMGLPVKEHLFSATIIGNPSLKAEKLYFLLITQQLQQI